MDVGSKLGQRQNGHPTDVGKCKLFAIQDPPKKGTFGHLFLSIFEF
jgi:hypothetical protein